LLAYLEPILIESIARVSRQIWSLFILINFFPIFAFIVKEKKPSFILGAGM
jgi:hypothetical protein